MWLISKIFGSKESNPIATNSSSSQEDTEQTVVVNGKERDNAADAKGTNNDDKAVGDRVSAEAAATVENSDHVTEGKATENKSSDNPQDGITNIYHLIVLDESGSMSGITQQTISGCNETIQTIRIMQESNKDNQKHFVSIYLFDSNNSRYIIKDRSIDKVREISSRDYRPNACTPLFDALGTTLTSLKNTIEHDKTIAYVTIITDGYENASREYTLEKVQTLIDTLKKEDVIFSFIGANVDSVAYAQSLHINNTMQFEQTAEGSRAMWERERRSKMRSSSKLRMFSKFHMEEAECFGAGENRGNYYEEDVPTERISASKIETLRDNEIFVFGSNTEGQHFGGAAYYAATHFGAVQGQAEGRQGQCYAIPTDGVSEEELYQAINRFCDYAAAHPELTFLVTAIGCGAAGLTPYIVAPMFRRASQMPNVKLPAEFWDYNDYTL